METVHTNFQVLRYHQESWDGLMSLERKYTIKMTVGTKGTVHKRIKKCVPLMEHWQAKVKAPLHPQISYISSFGHTV